MKRKNIIKSVAALALLALSTTSLIAKERAENYLNLPDGKEEKGALYSTLVKGRVVDTNNEILPGATIEIVGKHEGTYCDIDGYYSFANLAPGIYHIKVSYIGYDPIESEITVREGESTIKDFVMTSGATLSEVRVVSALSGERKAINLQKNSMGITNVVSQEQVGRFPDGEFEEGVVPVLLRRYENLQCDLSDGTPIANLSRDREYCVKFLNEFQDRLYFGTDACNVNSDLSRFILFFKNLRDGKKISEEVYDKIMFKNAEKLFAE